MKVLYMARTPLAGVCEKMARVVNEYRKPAIEARVCSVGPGKHRWYCRDPKLVPSWNIRNEDEVRQAIEWADVIHCMANVGIRTPGVWECGGAKLLKQKRWVYQWHGAQIWDFAKVWLPEDYPHVKFLHIGQGWIQTQLDFFGEFLTRWGLKVVPNVITDDKLHQPLPWHERKDKVGYAPSQRKETAVNRKGIPEMRRLIRGYQWDLIHGVPYEECLARKQKCRLGVDEIVTPMYHLSGLEFLSQGTPCICSVTESTEATLKEATGSDRMPFIDANPINFRQRLEWFWKKNDDDWRELQGREAREWFLEFYHPRSIIELYIDQYME